MKKPHLEILPPIGWQFIEALLAESKIASDNRMSKISVDVSLDDILRLFIITVEDSLEYEITTLIKGNKPLPSRENLERAIIDDRLDRLTEILKKTGITNEAIFAHIKLVRDQAFSRLAETNEKLGEAWSKTEILESDDEDIVDFN